MTDTVQELQSGVREAALEAARAFAAEVTDLRETDRGKFAILKRNTGNTLAEARGIAWFYRLLNKYAHRRDEEIYFLVATLIGHNKRTETGNFGASMKQLADKSSNREAVERRFAVLLDAGFDRVNGQKAGSELAFRLRQMVKLADSKEVGVDWAQLLIDLRQWNHPDKFVQKRWAASFYAAPQTETPEIAA
jgi:CRISPR system Cascade subunit CasB